MTRTSTPWIVRALLVAILGLAAVLRIRGLDFGLPAVYNPDEIAIMSRTLAFAKGDLNPHNFLYPTFYFYVLFTWLAAYFAGAWVVGAVPSLAAFQTQFFVDPSNIYLAGRALAAICGIATVWSVYALGSRVFDRPTGLIAAYFLAVAPTAVRDAHYVKHDLPVTLAIVVAYLAMLPLRAAWAERHGGDNAASGLAPAMLAGALCGVAFSTHYYAVFLGIPLLLSVAWAWHDRGWRATIGAMAAAEPQRRCCSSRSRRS